MSLLITFTLVLLIGMALGVLIADKALAFDIGTTNHIRIAGQKYRCIHVKEDK